MLKTTKPTLVERKQAKESVEEILHVERLSLVPFYSILNTQTINVQLKDRHTQKKRGEAGLTGRQFMQAKEM